MGRIRKKRQRMIRLISLLSVVTAFLIIVFVFQVKVIVVNGNERRTGQEIADGLSHDFLTQNSLYLMWKYREGGAPENLPYLSSLKIKLDSPGKITVIVTEKEMVGYIDKEQNLYFDEEGVLLEMTNQVYAGIPVVTGVSMGDPVLYQKIPTESSAQLRTILSILQLLRYQELDASEIRFSDSMDITVRIGNVDAVLGQDEYLEEKIANLRAILDVMDHSSGTLHMENFTGKNEPVSFSEGDIPASVVGGDAQEDETGGSDGTGQEDADGAGREDADGSDGTGREDADGSDEGAAENGTVDGDAAGEDGGEAGLGDGSGAGEGTDPVQQENADDGGQDDQDSSAQEDGQQDSSGSYFMVFDSSGTLRYDAHVVDGVVVDANGVPIDGCSVTEEGYVKDAYWNVIDPATGQLAQ